MKLKKNDLVKHPTITDWGIGKVLEDSDNNRVKVFFLEVGEKTFLLKNLRLEKLKPGEQSHPLLDNLSHRKLKKGEKYLSPSQSKYLFLQQFPGGFNDSEYLEKERDYKESAHLKAIEFLKKDEIKSLIETSEFEDVCSRALKVVNATNLIFPNEKMALKDGLKSDQGKELFSNSLYELLYGSEDIEKRFNQFAVVLEEIEASKWTTATYLPFMLYPDRYIFVKPTMTQRCAQSNHYEINYTPKLNWLTYNSILQFSEYLKEELKDLKPKDMIDIQSYIWLIARV